jgi:uncharacterized phage protein gp47/JayE
MAQYIRAPIETSPDTLANNVYAFIQSVFPNWVPNDGNLDAWLIRSIAQLASENRAIASDVQDDIFRYFGSSLMGLPPIDAVSAVGNTTWTLTDSVGHTIPAGTTVAIPDSNGNLQAFQVASDIVVPNGSSATTAGQVAISAVTPGSASSGLGGVGIAIQLIDVISWVSTVVLTGATSGGIDAEDDPTYLARLVTQLQRLSRRPILPQDFSSMALDADPTVARAVAIDGYNPADSSSGNQRMIAIAAVTAAGAGVSTGAKTAISTYLQANREINFIVNVMNPTFTTINVTTTIVVQTGYDTVATHNAVIAAITNYLSPAVWGQDPTVLQGSIANTWVETATLYYNEVITLISNVLGVNRVTALTLNGGTANISLTTPAALTQVGTVTVTP